MKPEFFDTQKQSSHTPRAILVGVEAQQNSGAPVGDSLDELAGLAETAHYDPVATLTQRLTTIHPKTYLGSGKVEELEQAVKHHEAEIVIFDETLSPAQTRNLEKLLKCNVVDRPWIILEIFSDHARTSEAKTQVELARLKYALPRLTRMWGHLSRQRGGIGMRDVGETQIQLDRRMIRDQISKLTKKLSRIHKEKQTQRKSRQTAYQVALVGYTNVGKSTLMNCLTGADTLVENKLFATLDATVRKVKKNFPYPILLADTVGLIDKLPHDLVASFKSTLDEVRNANLLVHVIDISHPHYRRQMTTAESVLNELGVHDTPTVRVFNKIDQLENGNDLEEMRRLYPDAVFVSCHRQTGMAELRQAIVDHYEARLVPYQVELAYTRSDLIPEIRKHALVVDQQYHNNAVTLDLRIWPHHKARLMELLNGYA
ncbi:GTPase HflX [Nitrospina watsonii]|uniref:GTPase HflX n=1 Tax=Nitrospina watsonii TaxID=1323948 RepID=A0ABM9HGS6_9BACT|nr:GTPase HflX [Nitrospina watsonii]CAI2719393.1 GTPase HflX [Nitrospina watsonii]